MSRRNDTPVPEYPYARKALKRQNAAKKDAAQKAPSDAEILSKAVTFIATNEPPRPPDPEPVGTSPSSAVSEPVQPTPAPKLGRFATKAELDEIMSKYKADGVCPICQVRIGRGIHGHVSKCLRLSRSKTESTKTS